MLAQQKAESATNFKLVPQRIIANAPDEKIWRLAAGVQATALPGRAAFSGPRLAWQQKRRGAIYQTEVGHITFGIINGTRL